MAKKITSPENYNLYFTVYHVQIAISIYKRAPISCVWTNICGRTEVFKNRLFKRKKKKKPGNFKIYRTDLKEDQTVQNTKTLERHRIY